MLLVIYGIVLFLSRLCGGEAPTATIRATIRFLSRLCGGEGKNENVWFDDDFLSRLCGGEEFIALLAIVNSLSKPPMWR